MLSGRPALFGYPVIKGGRAHVLLMHIFYEKYTRQRWVAAVFHTLSRIVRVLVLLRGKHGCVSREI